MHFPTRYRHAAKVAAQEAGRYAIAHLKLAGSRLLATDGRRLVSLPVDLDEHDADGFVTQEALLAACKAKHPKGRGQDAVLLANGDLRAPFASFVASRPTEGEFPRVEAVIPTFRAGDAGTASITFNAEYLAEIAACFATESHPAVTITFRLGYVRPNQPIDVTRGDVSPILVTGHAHDTASAFGVLMPVTPE